MSSNNQQNSAFHNKFGEITQISSRVITSINEVWVKTYQNLFGGNMNNPCGGGYYDNEFGSKQQSLIEYLMKTKS